MSITQSVIGTMRRIGEVDDAMMRSMQPPARVNPQPSEPYRGSPQQPQRQRATRVLANHEAFAEEAARAAQRYLDQVKEIESLIADRNEWCNRALLAEGEIMRFEKREKELLAQIEQKRRENEQDRAAHSEAITIIKTKYMAAGQIMTEGLTALDALDRRRASGPGREVIDAIARQQAKQEPEPGFTPVDEKELARALAGLEMPILSAPAVPE